VVKGKGSCPRLYLEKLLKGEGDRPMKSGAIALERPSPSL